MWDLRVMFAVCLEAGKVCEKTCCVFGERHHMKVELCGLRLGLGVSGVGVVCGGGSVFKWR